MEFFSQFDYDITYVRGKINVVADCLSRYYKNDLPDETHDVSEYVNADVRIDPEGEDLPWGRTGELKQLETAGSREVSMYMRTRRLREASEPRTLEAGELAVHNEPNEDQPDDPTVLQLIEHENLPPGDVIVFNDDELKKSIREGYSEDKLFSKVLENPDHFLTFHAEGDLITSYNHVGQEVICIPRTMHNRRRITEIVIDESHKCIGHFGSQKTIEYIRRWYWWPTLAKDVKRFCDSCGECQTSKS